MSLTDPSERSVTIPVGVARDAYTALYVLAADPRESEDDRTRYKTAARTVGDAIYPPTTRSVWVNGQYIGQDSSDSDTI